MKHFKFVSWQWGPRPRTPRRGYAPGPQRGFAPGPCRGCAGPPRVPPPVLPPPPRPLTAYQQQLQSLKPPISMSSSGQIVYAPRDESGHVNLRKVRITWPKVIATQRYLAITFDLVRRTSRSSALPHFRLSTRNVILMYTILFLIKKQNDSAILKSFWCRLKGVSTEESAGSHGLCMFLIGLRGNTSVTA